MILAVLTALEAASTTPADLVDRIFATHGVAAVAVSSEPRPFVFDGRRRDEVETANLARRWEIVVEPRYRAGRAVRLGQEAFFPQARADDEAVPDVPERALGQMGGTVVRVDQLLRGLQPPIELDPIYARRRVRVRLGVGGVEAALPGVARAVGARWEAKTRRIAFDPRTFRQSFLASVEGFSEGKAPGLADRRETMLRALAACSDADLTRAHKSETQWMFYVPFPLTREFRGWLLRSAAELDRRERTRSARTFADALDAGWTPAALIEPRQNLSLVLRHPDPTVDTIMQF